jgi:uncharacterized membrane protein
VEHPSSSARKRTSWAVLLGLAVLVAPIQLHRGALLDPIPLPYTVLAAILGALLGLALALRVYPALVATQRIRGHVAVLALPVLGLLLATAYARLAVEMIAFAQSPVRQEVVAARVLDTGNLRLGGHEVSIRPGGRKLQVRISTALYDRLARSAAPLCLRLDVQTGRGGVRRTMLPALLDAPWGTDRLTPCPPVQAWRVIRSAQRS